MFFRACALVVLCLWYSLVAEIKEEFKFNEYTTKYAEDFIKELSEEFPPLSEKEYLVEKKELAHLLKEQNFKHWSKVVTKIKTILTYNAIDSETLIDISVFCHNLKKSIKKRNYEVSRIAEYAPCLAYIKAKSKLHKAQALLLYVSTDDYLCNPQILDEINQLYPIEKIREEDHRFKEILKFEYLNHSIEEAPQGAILHLNFSQSLDALEPENYLEISPNVDGFMHANNKTISISGFKAGIEYKVKIRPGIKSVLNEKINASNDVGFFVKDLTPVINFPSNTYIYPKQEKIYLPVRAINIDNAKANLYRIPDRGIVNNLHSLMSRSYHLDTAEKIFSTDINFNGRSKPNQTITKNLDVSKILPELKPGIYVLEVRQKGVLSYYNAQVTDQWFIVTDIGLTTFTSDQTLVVHSRAFSSAKPLKGIKLELISADNDILGETITDDDGFAEFPKELLTGKAGKRPVAIFAKNDQLGFSFLSLQSAGFDFSDRGVKGRAICNDYDAMIFCERGIYRPDEKVNISAILRNGYGKEIPAIPLTIIIKSPKGTETHREILKGNNLGTYHMEYKLPADCTMGMWTAEVFIDPTKGQVGATSFRVDDFSPNKMELRLSSLSKAAKPGTNQVCNLTAYYLYGAPVHDRQAILEAKIVPNHTPFPKWQDFHFGFQDDNNFVSQFITGSTSSIIDGKAELSVAIPNDLSCSQALRVDLSARLSDVTSSQIASTSVNLITKPYLVGLREKESLENVEIEIITIDENGELISISDLEYTFFKSEAHYQWYKDNNSNWNYQLVYQDKPLKKGVITTNTDKPVLLSFKDESDASYAIEIKNKGTKLAKLRLGKQQNNNKDRPDNIVIVPETKVVKLGDNAVLKVNAPFEGEALIIAGLNTVQLKDTVHLKQGWNVLKIPTNETWGSGAYVMVSLVRALDKKTTGIVAKRAVGVHWIQVDPKDHIIEIKLDLPKEIKSRSQLKVPVSIESLNNEEARLMLAIVDEGVVGLTDFKTPDPITYFFGQRELGLEMRDVYGYLIDSVDADVIDMRSGGDSLMLRRGAFVPKVNDKVLSFFDGDVHLDNNGHAEIIMDIPVFFGKLKVYAVAIAKNKMGSQSGTVIVQDNLIVDPSLPSFLTVGDENIFNIRLENTTDKKLEFELSVNLEKALKANSTKQTITLNPGQEKRFAVTAIAKQIGDGIVNIEAKGDGINYQYSTNVEVRSAYQPVLVSNKHEIKSKETISLPLHDLIKGLHANDVQADLFITNQGPWNLGKIQKWLINYPFSCNQQIISKGFAAIFALKQCKDDVTDPNHIEYQRICYEVIQHLNEHQNQSGGWGMWPRENDNLVITAYALEMLVFAKDSGLTVPAIILERSLSSAKRRIDSLDWDIKRGREKADDVAGLVKLCAQTKEIDTSTTRYCFDEYFDKCDTAASKSLFIAAVASIQDLTRVQKGIKELNLMIAKGILMDEAAVIVANLTPFNEIETIKQTIQLLEGTLHKGINNDITKLNTQTLAMILKANFNQKLVNSKEIKISINKDVFSKINYISQILKPLQDLDIQNHGEDPVWLFINAYGIPSEPSKTSERGISLTRTFYKIDGTKINPENLSLGERVVVVLTGKITDPAHESYLMISEWLPAGFTHTNTIINYQWLKDTVDNTNVQKRHDRYIVSWKQPKDIIEFKIVYEVIAIHTGSFQQPGIHIENMINPAQYASYTPITVIVKENSTKQEAPIPNPELELNYEAA